jgi:hypothetical protein
LDANRPKSAELGLAHILIQEDAEVAEKYQAFGTPTAVLVHPDGTIGSPLAAGADAIATLLTYAIGNGLRALSSAANRGGV